MIIINYKATQIGPLWTRNLMVERIVSQDATYSSYYAIDVIKGRWPEAEAVIATDAGYASLYASYVIKGRWPEGGIDSI